jgi:hypothetical protein
VVFITARFKNQEDKIMKKYSVEVHFKCSPEGYDNWEDECECYCVKAEDEDDAAKKAIQVPRLYRVANLIDSLTSF